MRFTRKRGRPKATKIRIDEGTPELQKKRRVHATLEPIDWCLEKGLISEQCHDAACWLKWLHTIQYGVIKPRSVRWDSPEGGVERSEQWRTARKDDLLGALEKLNLVRAKREVYSVVIFSERPSWLVSGIKDASTNYEWARFVRGLEELAKLRFKLAKRVVT